MSAEKEAAPDIAAGILLCLASVPCAVFGRAWATATLWAWFVVPLGAPALGWAHAFGLSVLVHYSAAQGLKREDVKATTTLGKGATYLLSALLVPLVVVGFGWVAVRWM